MTRSRRGAGPPARRSWAGTPSRRSSSCPTRAASSWPLRTTGIPELRVDELVPEAPPARRAGRRWPRSPSATWSAHFTRLSHRQFSVDLGAYPLGSCTMKYNPKMCDTVAGLPGLAGVHPGAPASLTQGWLALLVELEEALCEITGMAAATLQPAAGAAGELTGLLLMRAWHEAQGSSPPQGDHPRLGPRHQPGLGHPRRLRGGHRAERRPGLRRHGRAARRCSTTDVAGIMLTNPNTLGLFEEDIAAIAAAVHEVGGLLYYDGANLNAILGVVRPGDMGFDIVHMNLHKTFATPHGGGGPGAGPGGRLRAPGRLPARAAARCAWPSGRTPTTAAMTPPQSIGRVHTWHGNALVLARALAYILVHGGDGLRRVAERAVLNANWIRQRLSGTYDVPFDRPCMHEVVLSAATLASRPTGSRRSTWPSGCSRRASTRPTVYFPLIVDEALMIEPTETESLADPRGAGRGARARSPPRRPRRGADGRGSPHARRCAGWTRPGRPAPWCRPSTPAVAEAAGPAVVTVSSDDRGHGQAGDGPAHTGGQSAEGVDDRRPSLAGTHEVQGLPAGRRECGVAATQPDPDHAEESGSQPVVDRETGQEPEYQRSRRVDHDRPDRQGIRSAHREVVDEECPSYGTDATGQRHQERESEGGGVGRSGGHRVTSLRPAAAPTVTSARPPTRLAVR